MKFYILSCNMLIFIILYFKFIKMAITKKKLYKKSLGLLYKYSLFLAYCIYFNKN